MADPVVLLGKTLQISVAPGVDDDTVATAMPVIQGAAAVLNAQVDHLTPTMLNYIGALIGLGVAPERSFTPCAGTADQGDGEYVYFFGAADIAQNQDPMWYASTIIHDGGHAWLSQQGQTAVGVPVEQALTAVQIAYYNAVGGRPTYIADLQEYISDPAAIQARIDQATGAV